MSSTALFRTEADIARRRFERAGPIRVDTSLGTISLRLTDTLPSLEALWEELQAAAPCTSAQTYDWAKACVRHRLAPEGRDAVIVIGCMEDGRPLFLWPFEMASAGGIKILHWLGQDHANYNMGLFALEAARKFTASDISRLLDEVADETGAAAAILKAQPFSWDGIANPFAKLPSQPAPSSGYAVTLGDFGALYKKRFSKRSRSSLERKERRLAGAEPLHIGWAETRDERLALVETLFAQKARQFAAMGVKDIFDAHTRAFYREVALLEGDNPSRLRLGYLRLGDAVLATFSGTICHKRMTVALSSLTEGQSRRQSPGALLLRHQIEEAARNGLAFYDIGVGAARHKDQWADVVQPLFDSFIAFKPHALLLTVPLAAAARLKRAIKSNRNLWPLMQRLRRSLLGREADSNDD
jgi:CelD/BcsL family acetyltransferase involved in cellulose biosynthesis